MTGHETACLLNASDPDASVTITNYFIDRKRLGPYRVALTHRTRQVRLNNPEIESDVPVVVHTIVARACLD